MNKLEFHFAGKRAIFYNVPENAVVELYGDFVIVRTDDGYHEQKKLEEYKKSSWIEERFEHLRVGRIDLPFWK